MVSVKCQSNKLEEILSKNLPSTTGFRGFENLGPYTPSNFAGRGMKHAAPVEYASKNIRVNAIDPTSVETPIGKAFLESMPDKELTKAVVTASNALPGLPQPCEVVSACFFLLSYEARYITGHTLPVDAGALSRIAGEA
mmetsp:Transcript_8946/g.13886  ORF Transcript_8946/g.13886 Transcript_8946/m.13886 type:complete len:139 (+) Transcript_8946:404-820(+)